MSSVCERHMFSYTLCRTRRSFDRFMEISLDSLSHRTFGSWFASVFPIHACNSSSFLEAVLCPLVRTHFRLDSRANKKHLTVPVPALLSDQRFRPRICETIRWCQHERRLHLRKGQQHLLPCDRVQRQRNRHQLQRRSWQRPTIPVLPRITMSLEDRSARSSSPSPCPSSPTGCRSHALPTAARRGQ